VIRWLGARVAIITDALGPVGTAVLEIGFATVLIGWLIVSFSPPGPRRERVEWVAACGLYVVLVSIFTAFALVARAGGNSVVLVAFGFLVLFFSSGFAVCLTRTLASLRGRGGKGAESATN
jgi:hypothetical protein